MKRAIKKGSRIYTYLEPFIQSGDEQAIEQARQEYQRRYKAAWRQAKRKTQKTFEISFDKDEWQIIRNAKLTHKRSFTHFIKSSALAYCQQKYLVPDQLAYNLVTQELRMVYNKLKDIEEQNRLPVSQIATVLSAFSSVQQTITKHLNNPQTLDEVLTEAIQTIPGYKANLLTIIQNS